MIFRIKGVNAENLPKRGGFILATNHVSYLDPFLSGYACPRPLNFMARQTLFRNWFFGWFLRAINVFPVRRGEGDMGSIREAVKRLKQGRGLMIFPEGTRSADGKLQEAKAGVGFLAVMAKVPIVPGFVKGTMEAMPRGTKKIKPHPVKVYFGKPFTPDFGSKDYQKIADEILKRIDALKQEYGN